MENITLERITETVATGGAVCLMGAGFSMSGTDQYGVNIPSTGSLIEEIKAAVGIDAKEQASLLDVADYCEDSTERQQKLRLLLIRRLTLCNPTDEQIMISTRPWRCIFTTNFDDLIEKSRSNGNLQIITPRSNPGVHTPGKTPLYYLHGRALDLIETDAEPSFVISERNYLQLNDTNRSLYARLRNEIFCSKLIVLLGYSVRDLEIARIILGDSQAFKEKTVIICDHKESALSLNRLNKFGTVLPIGISGIATAFKAHAITRNVSETKTFHFIEDVKSAPASGNVEGDDFINLILTGSFDRNKYQHQTQAPSEKSELYCIKRQDALDVILERSSIGPRRFIVSADLGNGKTVFLDQLSQELLNRGYKVFNIKTNLPDIFDEIEVALSLREPVAFILDDVIRYRRVAEFIGARLTAMCILVCSLRGSPTEVTFRDLETSLGGPSRHIDLNHLSISEIQDWEVALERWGLWEQRISLSQQERIEFLTRDCGGENRSIVLSLFRVSRIAERINQIVSFFLRRGGHQRAFVGLLISSLCQQHVSWESLVDWLGIDEARLREDISKNEISALFINGRKWNYFTSSQLADYILKTRYVEFDKDTLVDVFSTIVLRTAEVASDSYLGTIFRENLKELMKFRFLTRLFGDKDAAVDLIATVYRKLSVAPLIRKNPQFWLQYAMCRMAVNDISNADMYLKTALGLADEKGAGYSPYQILDQQARLFFMKNSSAQTPFSRTEINTAIKNMANIVDDPHGEIIYPYRCVPLIGKFIEAHLDRIDITLKNKINTLLSKIEEKGQRYTNLPRATKGETTLLRRELKDALTALSYA